MLSQASTCPTRPAMKDLQVKPAKKQLNLGRWNTCSAVQLAPLLSWWLLHSCLLVSSLLLAGCRWSTLPGRITVDTLILSCLTESSSQWLLCLMESLLPSPKTKKKKMNCRDLKLRDIQTDQWNGSARRRNEKMTSMELTWAQNWLQIWKKKKLKKDGCWW